VQQEQSLIITEHNFVVSSSSVYRLCSAIIAAPAEYDSYLENLNDKETYIDFFNIATAALNIYKISQVEGINNNYFLLRRDFIEIISWLPQTIDVLLFVEIVTAVCQPDNFFILAKLISPIWNERSTINANEARITSKDLLEKFEAVSVFNLEIKNATLIEDIDTLKNQLLATKDELFKTEERMYSLDRELKVEQEKSSDISKLLEREVIQKKVIGKSLKNVTTGFKQEISKLKKDNEIANEELRKLNKDNILANNNLTRLQSSYQKLTLDYKTMDANYEHHKIETNKKLTNAQSSVENAFRKNLVTKTELEQTKSLLLRYKGDLDLSNSEYKRDINKLQDENNKLDTEVNHLKQTLIDKDHKIDSLKNEIKTNEEMLQDIQKKMLQQQNSLAKENSDADIKESQADMLENHLQLSLEKANKKIITLEKDLAIAEQTNVDLNKKLSQVQLDIKDEVVSLQDKTNLFESANNEISCKLVDMISKNTLLKQELQVVEDARLNLYEEYEKHKKEVKEQDEKNVEQLKQIELESNKKEQQLQNLTKKLTIANNDLKVNQDRAINLQQQYEHLKSDTKKQIDELTDSLNSAEAASNHYMQLVKKVSGNHDILRRELEASQLDQAEMRAKLLDISKDFKDKVNNEQDKATKYEAELNHANQTIFSLQKQVDNRDKDIVSLTATSVDLQKKLSMAIDNNHTLMQKNEQFMSELTRLEDSSNKELNVATDKNESLSDKLVQLEMEISKQDKQINEQNYELAELAEKRSEVKNLSSKVVELEQINADFKYKLEILEDEHAKKLEELNSEIERQTAIHNDTLAKLQEMQSYDKNH